MSQVRGFDGVSLEHWLERQSRSTLVTHGVTIRTVAIKTFKCADAKDVEIVDYH